MKTEFAKLFIYTQVGFTPTSGGTGPHFTPTSGGTGPHFFTPTSGGTGPH
jgi:hypothetical protein